MENGNVICNEATWKRNCSGIPRSGINGLLTTPDANRGLLIYPPSPAERPYFYKTNCIFPGLSLPLWPQPFSPQNHQDFLEPQNHQDFLDYLNPKDHQDHKNQ